ncbi:MAG: hypothetical protein ACLRWP_01590 [Bilophila wadsworthia]
MHVRCLCRLVQPCGRIDVRSLSPWDALGARPVFRMLEEPDGVERCLETMRSATALFVFRTTDALWISLMKASA